MMTRVRVLVSRLLDLALQGRRDRRLRDEVQAHLDQLTEEHVARGMPAQEARLAARRAFGGVDQVKARYRDQRGVPMLSAIAEDVRFGVRLLARDPGFALTAVLVLGTGIGVNNLFFTIAYSHTLRGMPIPGADRVLTIQTMDKSGAQRGVSFAEVTDLRASATSFAGIAAYSVTSVGVGDPGRPPDRLLGTYVSANGFTLVGAAPVAGRAFGADEDRPGMPPVAMLGEGTWRSRYGGDTAAIGRTVLVNGLPTTIVGILPDRSGFPSSAEVWMPLGQMPGIGAQGRDARGLSVFGRVGDGVPAGEAEQQVHAAFDRMAVDHAATNTGIRALVMPINDLYFGQFTHPAWLAFFTAGFLIALIACANVANLMLSRSIHRAREIAIRTSLGAGRARVVRQLLVESAVLAALGGLLGLALGTAAVRVFAGFVPRGLLGYWVHYSPDASILAALVIVSLATVFVFGLVPALHASRTDVIAVLKDGGRANTANRGARRWTTAFVAAELALTVLLLANQSMNLRDTAAELPSDAAIRSNEILTAAITLPAGKYAGADERRAFHDRLIERLAAIPGVSSAALTSHLPLGGAIERELEREGLARSAGEPAPPVWTARIAPGYFATLDLPMTRGRDFDAGDSAPGRAHAIVNQRAADLFFPNDDPIGRRIALRAPQDAAAPPAWLTIVGVAPSIRMRASAQPDPIVYVPLAPSPPALVSLLVRSPTDAAALTSALRATVLDLDSNLPVYRAMTLAQSIREATWNSRVAVFLISLLTVLALTLSTVGLYAVTAHDVGRRVPELGLRLALGARGWQIRRLVVKDAAIKLGFGLAAGLLCTVAWDRAFVPADARARLWEPGTLATVAAVLAVVLLAACLAPARRATRLDPAAALREN